MKRILFVTMAYRVGERIYPIIPELAKDYKMDVLRVNQMHKSFVWPGSKDLRLLFESKYQPYFENVFYETNEVDFSNYDGIIYDDCRGKGVGPEIYSKFKKYGNGSMISCSHGNVDKEYHNEYKNRVFDHIFLYGDKEVSDTHIHSGGIPANDNLSSYLDTTKKHILLVTNFLREQNVCKTMSGNFFRKLGLKELQDKHQLPVLVKIKSRSGESPLANIETIKRKMPSDVEFEVVVDVLDDNLMVAESKVVLGAPSTLMLKPIQMKIPTAVIREYGQHGVLSDYDGLVDLDKSKILNCLESQPSEDFIERTICGGLNFNSTQVFVDKVKKLI